MHRYQVTIDFKKGPSFSYEVMAKSDTDAIRIARREAPGYGFNEQEKKAVAVEL